MSHHHKFSYRTRPSVSLNGEGRIIVRRECQGSIVKESRINDLSGKPSFKEEPCDAKKTQIYDIKSVTDRNEIHDKPENSSSVTVTEGGASNSGVPEWVDEVIERAKAKFKYVNPENLICHLEGPQISMMVATSDNEYNVVLNRVGVRVEEN